MQIEEGVSRVDLNAGGAMAMDALVTGASTCIGRAAAKVLTSHGWRVFAGLRKAATH
jgi:NAD(P)-dependent dehydrogenase (short-subunit alcohol dehydrogenase family)